MEQIEEEDWTGLLEENEPTSSEAAFQFGDVSLEEIEQFEKVDSDIERDEEQQLEVPLDKRDTTVEGLKESDRTTEHLKTPSLSDDDDAKVDRLLMEALKDYETQLSPIGD